MKRRQLNKLGNARLVNNQVFNLVSLTLLGNVRFRGLG